MKESQIESPGETSPAGLTQVAAAQAATASEMAQHAVQTDHQAIFAPSDGAGAVLQADAPPPSDGTGAAEAASLRRCIYAHPLYKAAALPHSDGAGSAGGQLVLQGAGDGTAGSELGLAEVVGTDGSDPAQFPPVGDAIVGSEPALAVPNDELAPAMHGSTGESWCAADGANGLMGNGADDLDGDDASEDGDGGNDSGAESVKTSTTLTSATALSPPPAFRPEALIKSGPEANSVTHHNEYMAFMRECRMDTLARCRPLKQSSEIIPIMACGCRHASNARTSNHNSAECHSMELRFDAGVLLAQSHILVIFWLPVKIHRYVATASSSCLFTGTRKGARRTSRLSSTHPFQCGPSCSMIGCTTTEARRR